MSLKGAARDTLALIDAGTYTTGAGTVVSFAADHAASLAGTHLYTPAELEGLTAGSGPAPAVEVTDETTQVAAYRLAEAGDVLLLNFASARNPGGGFLNGAKAQEEDLCRCSGLYPTLLECPTYYAVNRRQKSLLYTDHLIYSPRVVFFRTRGRGDLLEVPFLASVITAPAPNTGPLLRKDPSAGPAIAEAFRRRWRNVLLVAAHRGHRTLVLGAWGCGAFGGDPAVAADAAATVIGELGGAFAHLAFAIPDRGRQGHRNHTAFRARLSPTGTRHNT